MNRLQHLAAWLCVAVFLFIWGAASHHFDLERARVESDNARIAKAAQRACGHEAAWRWIDSKTVQCLMHNGRRAQTVAFK